MQIQRPTSTPTDPSLESSSIILSWIVVFVFFQKYTSNRKNSKKRKKNWKITVCTLYISDIYKKKFLQHRSYYIERISVWDRLRWKRNTSFRGIMLDRINIRSRTMHYKNDHQFQWCRSWQSKYQVWNWQKPKLPPTFMPNWQLTA